RFGAFGRIDRGHADQIVAGGYGTHQIELREAHAVELAAGDGFERREVLAVGVDALDVQAFFGEPAFGERDVDPEAARPFIGAEADEGARGFLVAGVTGNEQSQRREGKRQALDDVPTG